MSVLVQHWAFDPVLVVLAVAAAVYTRGVRRLNRRAPRGRRQRRWRQGAFFYVSLVVVALAISSPVDYWSDRYLWSHMVQHVLLMFAAPIPLVASAPWVPLQHGLPVAVRRPVVRALATAGWSAPLRAATRGLTSPWVAVAAFNAAMVVWHLPGPFDWGQHSTLVHIWLEHGSFFVAGVAFWLQFINSRPFRVRLTPSGQMAAIFITSIVMWFLAMAMSVFSAGPWYPWYLAHEGSTLTPFADQQIAAGILWICGDFWAVPAMVRAVRRLMDAGEAAGAAGALDRFLSGVRRRPQPEPTAVLSLGTQLTAHQLAERQAAAVLAAHRTGAPLSGG
ncbi:MAG TPA: cytochrome c oxidase assembly protein [Acidimicrobiales bacterium]|nr:cytochrome c oxidase assembly protein [Acidimicrobiales bacterium]